MPPNPSNPADSNAAIIIRRDNEVCCFLDAPLIFSADPVNFFSSLVSIKILLLLILNLLYQKNILFTMKIYNDTIILKRGKYGIKYF